MKIHRNNITTLYYIYLAAEACDLRYYIYIYKLNYIMYTNSFLPHSAYLIQPENLQNRAENPHLA